MKRRGAMNTRLGTVARVVAVILLVTACGGCADAVIFSTSNLVGIEVDPVENGQQNATVALQTADGVAMPACKDTGAGGWPKPCGELLPKAYSVLAVSYVSTGSLLLAGLSNVSIKQVFATGKAATTDDSVAAVAATFTAIEATYQEDHAGDCISAWLESDPKANNAALIKWWNDKGHTGNAFFLVRSDKFAAERNQFVADKNITCH